MCPGGVNPTSTSLVIGQNFLSGGLLSSHSKLPLYLKFFSSIFNTSSIPIQHLDQHHSQSKCKFSSRLYRLLYSLQASLHFLFPSNLPIDRSLIYLGILFVVRLLEQRPAPPGLSLSPGSRLPPSLFNLARPTPALPQPYLCLGSSPRLREPGTMIASSSRLSSLRPTPARKSRPSMASSSAT